MRWTDRGTPTQSQRSMRGLYLESSATAICGTFAGAIRQREAETGASGRVTGMNEQIIEAQEYARAAAAKILRDRPDDVDDVLQSAALNALRFERQYRGNSQFKVWFMRIVINEALYVLRRERNMKGRFVELDKEVGADESKVELPSASPSPEVQAIGTEVLDFIRAEVRKMSPKRRAEVGYLLLGIGPTNKQKCRRWHVRRILRKALREKGILAEV